MQRVPLRAAASIAIGLALLLVALLWRTGERRPDAERVVEPAQPHAPVEVAVPEPAASLEDAADTAETSPPAPAPGMAILAGRVLDADGAPIAGAEVSRYSYPLDGRPARESSESGIPLADAGGRYSFEVRCDERHAVFARDDGHRWGYVEDIVLSAGERREDVDIVLPRGGAVSGRVVDENGMGVAHARVVLRPDMTSVEDRGPNDAVIDFLYGVIAGDATPDARTDRDGQFVVRGIRAGAYLAWATAEDLPSGENQRLEIAEGTPLTGVTFALGFGERLSVRVLDPTGAPVEDADVSTDDSSSPWELTDSDGRAVLRFSRPLRLSRYTISVGQTGYETVSTDVFVPRDELVVTLEPRVRVSGLVRGPVGEVSMHVRVYCSTMVPRDDAADGLAAEVERTSGYGDVEDDGRFEVWLAPGRHLIRAFDWGTIESRPVKIVVSPGENLDGVIVDLVRRGELRGTVIDPASGAPVEKAWVAAFPEGSGFDRFSEQCWEDGWQPRMTRNVSTSTDAAGRFVLPTLPDAPFDLEVTHYRHLPWRRPGLRVPIGRDVDVRVELQDGAALRARVSSEGAPVYTAFVSLERCGSVPPFAREGFTDGEGEVVLEGLVEGEYEAYVEWSTEGHEERRNWSTVIRGNETQELVIDEPAGVRVIGRVLFGGAPAGDGESFGHSLTVWSRDERWSAKGHVRSTGGFVLGVPGPGSYWVQFGLSDARFVGEQLSGVLELEVPDRGTIFRRDIELPDGEVAGVVVDSESGLPVHEFWLEFYRTAGERDLGLSPDSTCAEPMRLGWISNVDQDGRFRLRWVAPGTHTLRVHAEGYASRVLTGITPSPPDAPPTLRIALEREGG